MKLPNIEKASIPSEKLRDYLLSPSHPVGQFKVAFFRSFGDTQSEWKRLESDSKNSFKRCRKEGEYAIWAKIYNSRKYNRDIQEDDKHCNRLDHIE